MDLFGIGVAEGALQICKLMKFLDQIFALFLFATKIVLLTLELAFKFTDLVGKIIPGFILGAGLPFILRALAGL